MKEKRERERERERKRERERVCLYVVFVDGISRGRILVSVVCTGFSSWTQLSDH